MGTGKKLPRIHPLISAGNKKFNGRKRNPPILSFMKMPLRTLKFYPYIRIRNTQK
jgi:hypothetical protein